MKLIVGLGNPGPQYASTRHNAGFMVVDRLALRHHFGGAREKFHSRMLTGPIAGENCALMLPLTFMNRSGLAVAEAVRFYRFDPATDLLIVVDDVALPCGRVRLRPSGSAGGHNGLADVESALASTHYPRLRIGIDAPGPMSQTSYVLGRFTPQQHEIIQKTLETACDAIESWLGEGIDRAMNRFNEVKVAEDEV